MGNPAYFLFLGRSPTFDLRSQNMNKFFKNTFGSAILLIATFFASFAQAQTYFLSHSQSGNENRTLIFNQQDVLLVGGILHVFQDGASVNGSVCSLEVEVYSSIDDQNFQPLGIFAFSHTNLLVDSSNGREVVPITFVAIPNGNSFKARVTFRNLSIPLSARLQVRGNVTNTANTSHGFVYGKFTNITPCNSGVSDVVQQTLQPITIIVPQKLGLELSTLVKQSDRMVRRANDPVGIITVHSLGVRNIALCPKISGAGMQPSGMRLVTERGLQFFPNNGCFYLQTNPEKITTSWTLTTNTTELENTVDRDIITVDFVGFPEPQYQLVGGNIVYRTEYTHDLPKPIVLEYD